MDSTLSVVGDGEMDTTAARELDRELVQLRIALSLVSSGAAPGITLLSPAFGQELLARAASIASLRGLIVEPVWHPDDAECDLRITRAPVRDPSA